jgi:predicted nucleic acid-binding protein
MPFIDTNVLIYAISPVEKERYKAQEARKILRRDDLTLSVQVLQEFYVQVTRPTRTDPLSHSEATALIGLWLRFPIVEMSVALMQAALGFKERHQISYWDAAILAAAASARCAELYSEDLNAGQTYDGVRVVNPFS